MKRSDFYFDLPEELIAQTPLAKRDSSRLLSLGKESGEISHKHFWEIKSLLKKGDVLVINDSRVLPARILGETKNGGQMEFLLLKAREDGSWEVLTKPGKKARVGSSFSFGGGILKATVTEILEDGKRAATFTFEGENLYEVLDRVGQMPLPPYITEKLEDGERYQTVYSKEVGSAAAPTAGLHFTDELLAELEEMGVEVCRVTLHVGLGTFRPVKAEKIEDHLMHTEHYTMPQKTADALNAAKKEGRRVIAVGTTSCRTLESVAQRFDGSFEACDGDTSIFIYPGYEFRAIDGLLTNFHLPESTLIMLVSALAGRENVLAAYEAAVAEKYRFFSFGDAMLIL